MGRKIAIAAGALLLVLVAGGAWIWFSGGSGEPSAEVTAPTITTATSETETSEAGTEAAGPKAFSIDKTQSSVQFELDELLNDAPKHVVGTTTEVAGQFLIDFANPTESQMGTVVINVRTLETDSSFRDRAIRGRILDSASDENEFAEFAPTSIEGLPASVAIGDVVPLRITGDFALSGVTQPVTFDVEVTLASEDRIEVTGSALVLRSDFGLNIPSVPQVADVSDEVMLVIDLVALAG